MSERRKWEKQAPTHEPFVATAAMAAAPVAAMDATDPVLEKQLQYIKMLEERNRLKKKLAAATKKDAREKQREDAFVTTFNVATAAVPTGGNAPDVVRKNKSAAALLPTKMHPPANEGRGRSAPSTTLPLRTTPRGVEEDVGERKSEAKHEPAVRRAKWSKPTAGEAFNLETRDGRACLSVGAKEDEIVDAPDGVDSNETGEEDYLEESFEAFEGTQESENDRDVPDAKTVQSKEIAAHKISRSDEEWDEKLSTATMPARADSKRSRMTAVETVDASSSAGLSRTTVDLFSVIQNLSRSKQKALVDVLQKFESSAQEENDVQTLRSSIGDPTLWKQVTAALFGKTVAEDMNHQSAKSTSAQQSNLSIAQVMEEQRKWEENYARQMQLRLAEEREAKEKTLREAEQRRLLLMQQLEEEEKELERLMEEKRLQRLAKLRALEQEDDDSTSSVRRVDVREVESKENKAEMSASEITADTTTNDSPDRAGDTSSDGKALNNSIPSTSAVEGYPSIPMLSLPTDQNMVQSSSIDLRLRLLSTWGNTRAVGLTQICAYDLSGLEIEIDVNRVKIYERADGRPLPKSHEMMRMISRLFNGVAQTNSDQDMWLGRLSDHGTLEIAMEFDNLPSKLCVWNYNSKMCSACARDVELIVGGRSVWSGSLPQGFGDEDDNMCTWISCGAGPKKTARVATTRTTDGQEKPKNYAKSAATDDTKATMQSTPSIPDIVVTPANHNSSSSAPIWLAASSSTSSLLTTKQVILRADAKDSSLHALDGPADKSHGSGHLSSRRQRSEPPDHGYNTPKSEKTHLTESKQEKFVVPDQRDAFLARKDRERWSTTGALASSWDSLEHFSKTSRSRLPSATEESSPLSLAPEPSAGLRRPSFVPSTTSSLLEELRGGSHTVSSSPSSAIRASEKQTSVLVPVEIPELPSGRRLKLDIVSTWGDQYYVGLNGIEIFDKRGKIVTFSKPDSQIVAYPASINVLDEYDDDPRVAKNLVDGVNCTCDDFHMWLAPYTGGQDHYVSMMFEHSTAVSMVRVWNYNKSRAHTYRGVRQIRLVLFNDAADDQGRVIFEGEIKRAPGGLFRDDDVDNAMWCEVILFTTDQSILRKIEANDALLQAHGHEQEEEEETSAIVTNARSSMELRRPKTADTGTDGCNSCSSNSNENELGAPPRQTGKGRPATSAIRAPQNMDVRKSVDTWVGEEPQQKSPVLMKVVETKEESNDDEDESLEGFIRGRRLVLRLLSTWGDRNYIGLTQLEVLVGNHGSPIPLDLSNIDASPRDLATLGYEGDPRTLDKLVNGIGATCDDTNMWLIPFGSSQEIRIDLKREQYVYGLRIWNYNKSLEDSFRGVKQIAVTIDGELVSPRQTGFVLRKAPGAAFLDFDQIVRFGSSEVGDKRDRAYVEKISHPIQNRSYKSPNVKQDYEPVLYPQGFALKLVLWTTWGDPYYIGLNGLELYDHNGKRITVKPSIVTAQPHSLADINQQASPQDDVRVPENLLSGRNKNTWDASDAWLAPLASSLGASVGNIVYVAFDMPIALSLIKFWNYSKTPERGVKDLDIYLDDLHIFSGTLRKAPHGNGAQNIGRFGPKQLVVEEFSQPVLFSTNQSQVDAEKRRVYYCGTEEQDVLCINEGQVVQESKAMYRKPDPGAEGVVVDLGQRPMTAMSRK